MTDLAQPNASRLPCRLLEALLETVAPESSSSADEVVHRDEHSNDLAEIRLTNGRSLIVKRARHDWAEPRFRSSRIASRLIREATAVAVPAPLEVPPHLDERPLEAYWRIDLPTLQDLWPELSRAQRQGALRSWGALTGRLHSVRLQGFGPLSDPETPERSLMRFLHQELAGRLQPAVAGEWPAAIAIVETLIETVPEVSSRAGHASHLVHNDLHMGNVLCQEYDDAIRCVGLLDLETSVAAPPEADIAAMEVHHGPFFTHHVPDPWKEQVRLGYESPIDDWVVNFYRALHLINMGFYSAIIGHADHADHVAEAARSEVAALRR